MANQGKGPDKGQVRGKSGEAHQRQVQRGQDVIRHVTELVQRPNIPADQILAELREWLEEREAEPAEDEAGGDDAA